MSNLYVAEATVTARLGSRATALLDRDGDGSADSGLLTSIIESKGRWINMKLAQRYSTPFAEITDDPATPEEIQELALELVLAECYSHINPESPDASMHLDMADAALQSLLDGDYDLSGASRVKHNEGRHIVSATYGTPVGGLDSSDADRLRGI